MYKVSTKFRPLMEAIKMLIDSFARNGHPAGARNTSPTLRRLSTLRGLRGAPEVPPLCRGTQSLGQQMLNASFGINGSNGCCCNVEIGYSPNIASWYCPNTVPTNSPLGLLHIFHSTISYYSWRLASFTFLLRQG